MVPYFLKITVLKIGLDGVGWVGQGGSEEWGKQYKEFHVLLIVLWDHN